MSSNRVSGARIAVVQFDPKFCRVDDNIKKAKVLCAGITPGSVDLVCLSEMVFTGYVFPNADSIKPFLEEPTTGPTSRFCSELAAHLQCHVVAGYPERLRDDEMEPGVDEWGNNIMRVGANSAVLFGPNGECVGRYRKTNLYETDTTWAKPGTGFVTFSLPPPLNSVSLGICMDLNVQKPLDWETIEGPCEIASYCVAEKSNILLLLNAWLESPEDSGDSHAWTTMNFWAHRLRPLWEPQEGVSTNDRREINVVICNRTGNENGKKFCGSSCSFKMQNFLGRPKLTHSMGKDDEGVGLWTM